MMKSNQPFTGAFRWTAPATLSHQKQRRRLVMASVQNRRVFLKSTAAIGVGAWILGPDLLAAERSANEAINIACIGVGGKGSSDTDHAGNHGNLVALCDIDDNRLGAKATKFPKARKFNDFRRMLEDME